MVPYQEIERRLPEIKSLGANVVWIMSPLASGKPGQGYDTIDHFRLAKDFGSEADLKSLIATAHRNGLKVILDLALNHTSVAHPFAKDVSDKGRASKHFSFYQREALTNVAFNEHFHLLTQGLATFVYYFWNELVNLNYENPRVRKYALDVAAHWLKILDHDGYRFDASWGPSSRWPGFYRAMSGSLRSIKEDIFLLAEDRASYPSEYEGRKHPHLQGSGFDAAYDWSIAEPGVISQWQFSIEGMHETIFNFGDAAYAADVFRKALRDSAAKQQLPALRYLENNDTESFDQNHSEAQLKWAAQTVYSLPGPMLIFYGQAEGFSHEQWHLPSLDPSRKLSEFDPKRWRFYQKLIKQRQLFDSEIAAKFVSKNKEAVSFHRFQGGKKISFLVDFKNQRTTN